MSPPLATDLIRAKREGRRLDAGQLAHVAAGIASGAWSEGQVGAFAMAVAWRGMSIEECSDFTLALRDSGERLHWDHLSGPVLDKHSTGGVGDCVSLLVAPLLAACGGFVPMISGRGLGHTGGTLDKLESIPGYDVNPSASRLRDVVGRVGCAIIGQSAGLVPADRRLYAVRDVSATVDVPDLMVASILCKKLAGGAGALVLDVKTGSGAQLPDMSAARALADRMLAVAGRSGLKMRVALTDMGQVLGRDAGNALEVRAVIDLLRGKAGCPRLLSLGLDLAAELLCLGGLARDSDAAMHSLRAALASGEAAERFGRMVAALGGPVDLLDRPDSYLARAPVQQEVPAPEAGFLKVMDVRAVGQVVVELGGGRTRPDQSIDPSVGLSAVAGVGDSLELGQALAVVHARSPAEAQSAVDSFLRAIRISGTCPDPVRLLIWHEPAGLPA